MDFKILFLQLFIPIATSYQNTDLHYRSLNTHGNSINWSPKLMNIRDRSKVKITLYYETLCPGSRRFIVRQLQPVVEKLAPYLDIHLVPYGHAQNVRVRGRHLFRCQHGPEECFGNALHACTTHILQDNNKAALLISCLTQYLAKHKQRGARYGLSAGLLACAPRFNAPKYDIWNCANSDLGAALLKRHGDETDSMNLRYVPYIVLEGSTREEQSIAETNLFYAVCHMLWPKPQACYR